MSDLPRRIVVAVDFGDASAAAVRVAGYIAGRSNAALRLVHAETIEAPLYFTPAQVEALEAQRRNARVEAERYLAAFGRREIGNPFDVAISEYVPVEAVLREAEDADLVVTGTHGRRGPARWWLGSVAERVLREVQRPLVVVRAGARSEGLVDSIEVRASAGADGEGALKWARALAGASGRVVDRRAEVAAGRNVANGTTLLVVAMPEPRTARWLSEEGEPWLRNSPVPIAFIPESGESS